jgi:hypothetical protein
MRRSDRLALNRALNKPPPKPPDDKTQKGLIVRLLGFWLFHKLLGGDR